MSDRTGSGRGRTTVGHGLQPDRQGSLGRWRSDGLQRAHHHSRPEERPAAHHARGDHRGLRPAVGLGPLGRGPVGAQSARGRPRDHHRAPPERRSPCDRAGPDTARRVLSRRPWSARARHPVRGLVHSHRRWGRSRPILWRRPRVDVSSNSTHFDEVGCRSRGRVAEEKMGGAQTARRGYRSILKPVLGTGGHRSASLGRPWLLGAPRRPARRFADRGASLLRGPTRSRSSQRGRWRDGSAAGSGRVGDRIGDRKGD